jgi:hypothetical protein
MKNDEKTISMFSWYIKILRKKEIELDIIDVTIEAVELGTDEVELHFLPKEEFEERSCSNCIWE